MTLRSATHCSSRASARSSTSGPTTAQADRSRSRSARGIRGRLDVAVNPSSFRKPRPILSRGTLNPAAIADTAARGWPVFTATKDPAAAREQMAGYHAALAASGHDAETIRLAKEWTAYGKAVHVAETDELAKSEAEAYFIKNPSEAIARNADDMICGSPDTVTRTMRAFAEVRRGIDDLRVSHRPRKSVAASSQRASVQGRGHPTGGGVRPTSLTAVGRPIIEADKMSARASTVVYARYWTQIGP